MHAIISASVTEMIKTQLRATAACAVRLTVAQSGRNDVTAVAIGCRWLHGGRFLLRRCRRAMSSRLVSAYCFLCFFHFHFFFDWQHSTAANCIKETCDRCVAMATSWSQTDGFRRIRCRRRTELIQRDIISLVCHASCAYCT